MLCLFRFFITLYPKHKVNYIKTEIGTTFKSELNLR